MVKNATWLLLGRGLSDVISFIFYVSLARSFGESGIGVYAFAFAVAILFVMGVELGLRQLVTREVAGNHEMVHQYYWNMIVLQLCLSLVLGSIMVATAMVFAFSEQTRLLLVIIFAAESTKAIGLSCVACLEAKEAMNKSASIEVMSRLAMAGSGIALILLAQPLPVVTVAHVLGGLAYMTMAGYMVKREFGIASFSLDMGFMKRIVSATLPFAGGSLLYIIYGRVDVMMIHHFVGETETGIYAVAFRCIESALVVAAMIGLAVYPVLSANRDVKARVRRQVFLDTLKWLSILGAGGAAVIYSVASDVLVGVFGQAYAQSGELLRIMALLFALGCVKVAYWRLLCAARRERTSLMVFGVSVLANIALNLLLIPRYGAYGAVWASLLSEIGMIGAFHMAAARIIEANYWKPGANLLGVSTAIALMSWSLGGVVHWVGNGIATLTAFIILAVLTGLVTKADREAFSRAWIQLKSRTAPAVL